MIKPHGNSALCISIIIPCRNEGAHIGALLESILSQEMGDSDWEAIVADGMSDDGTRELLDRYRARCPKIRMIDNPARYVSTGLNAAIQVAKGEIILRMDAHTSYAPDYVRRCVETLQSTGAGNVGGPARASATGFWGRAIASAYRSPFACGGARFHDPAYEGYADTVPYGCWRRDTLIRLGGFDEAMIRNQDDELNLRLTRSGEKIWQSPSIVSWYTPRSRLSSLFGQYFQYGFWKVAVILKHRIPASWRHIVPATWVLTNIGMLLGVIVCAQAGWASAWLALMLIWTALLSVYAAACLIAAVHAAWRDGWMLLPVLPLVFSIFHYSYGIGFLAGMAQFLPAGRKGSVTPGRLFTQLTR